MPTKSGLTGNQNATKPEDLKRSSRLILALTPREKAGYVKAASRQKQSLAAWVREACDTHAEKKS